MAEELLLDLMYSVRISKMWISKFKKSYAFAVYRMIQVRFVIDVFKVGNALLIVYRPEVCLLMRVNF